MNIKKAFKTGIVKVVGINRALYVYSRLRYCKEIKVRCEKGLLYMDKDSRYRVFGIKNRHVFFGYYDVKQFDSKNEKMLAMSVKKGADPAKDDADIGYYDLSDYKSEYIKLTQTGAWCWQQGARLRFHPHNDNIILFNDISNNTYVCKEYDIEKRKVVNEYQDAFYDIDNDMKYGLTINYSRLQRLRPGYGYGRIYDRTKENNAPDNDGIFRVNLKNGKKELLVSLYELAMENDSSLKYQHYINHISFAPDGKHAIFLHIYVIEGMTKWKTRLFVMDVETGERKLLEEELDSSHYAWKNEREILITRLDPKKKKIYAIYNIVTGENMVLGENILTGDGHPTCLKGGKRDFISDTYPDRSSYCHLFIYEQGMENVRNIGNIYHDPRFFLEKKCDLHPRVSRDERLVSVDTLFKDKQRRIILIELAGIGEDNV